jgi:DNA-directed RNA polymerase subunit RPC12/RpoP
MSLREYGDSDDKPEAKGKKNFDEFDCLTCNANNPYGDGFKEGDEVRCYYCGTEFLVRVDDSGRLKLKEL